MAQAIDASRSDQVLAWERGERSQISVTLRGKLGITEAASLHGQLLTLLSQGGSMTFDGGSVEKVDAAALQVLWAFCREARQKRLDLEWGAVSDNLLQAAALLGLSEGMGLAAK